MKRIQATLLIALLLTGLTSAQDQLENPGFEDWEEILVSGSDTIREPVEWSSLKTTDNPAMTDLAPVVCNRSSDAHSGDYSVELTNVLSFIVANGVVTNGLIHPDINPLLAFIYTDTVNAQWNTPFDSRPDSLSGWFKYSPQGADTLQIKVALHRGYGQQPDAAYTENWIAVTEFRSPLNTGNEWVRFSTPFTYFSEESPQYVLVVLNSGNEYTPVANSIALFDDFEMIYNTPQAIPERKTAKEGFLHFANGTHLIIRDMEYSLFQHVRIHDLTGKLVWDGPVATDRVDIAAAGLGKGIYIVMLTGKSASFSQKILVL